MNPLLPDLNRTAPTPAGALMWGAPAKPVAADMSAGHPRRLILGLGNELLTDDAIGFRVVAAIQPDYAQVEGTMVSCSSDVGLGLLEIVCGYEEVVLIDAVQTGTAEVGYVHEMTSDQLRVAPGIAPHFMGIAEMLALGRELGLAVPSRLRIFAVEVEDPYSLGTSLSARLGDVLPSVVARIRAKLAGND